MKRLVFILIGLFLISMLAQNWTNVIDTDVDVSTASGVVDVFANGHGLNIIYQESNSLKYCRVDVLGNKYASSPVTLESSAVIWPSITGNENIIYVVYKKSGETSIKTKYSTDAGSNWHTLGSSPTSSNADFIESDYSNGLLHVTWQVSSQVKYSSYEDGVGWSSPYTVSGTESGAIPRIVAWNGNGENKVYFYYKNSSSVSKWREYNVTTNSWGNIQTAFSVTNSTPSGFAVDGSNIALFYNYYDAPTYYFQWVIRSKSNNSLLCTRTAEPTDPRLLFSTNTVDEQMHAVFWFDWQTEQEYPGIWRSRGDVDCSIDEVYTNIYQEQQNVHFINTSASSNDVYVIWQDDYIGDNLRLIYDDLTPLAPQNLAVQIHTEGGATYPKLTWSFNNEPDVFIKTNAYQVWRRYSLSGGDWSAWYIIGYSDGDENQYIDYTISGLYAEANTAEYKLKVRDYTNHFSDYSSSVSVNFSEFNKISTGYILNEFRLEQNYPNPFNPTTTISYSIKSAGLVALKVYDLMGREVAALVNEVREAGSYSVTFNATNLPSGIYFYTLTSGNFTSTKKLILLK